MKVYIVSKYSRNEKYNFYGNKKRFLVYTDKPKSYYKEIDENELSQDEQEWLNYCKTLEAKNGLEQDEETIKKWLEIFAEKLEEEKRKNNA